MAYYFAWVEAGTPFNAAVHNVMDEDIFEFVLDEVEGDFATLSLVIANPGAGLLYGKQWAWFAEDVLGVPTPRGLFRINGVPSGLQHEELTVFMVARPVDFVEQKAAIAAQLRDDPYRFDPVFVEPESISDPDAAFLARTAVLHTDPVTHVVSVTDKIVGEDGLVAFGVDEVFYDPSDLTYANVPAKRFEMTATVRWTQRARGEVDISANLITAFSVAGTTQPFVISSYTATGLVDDWPLPGDNIGAGWKVAESNAEDGGGRWVSNAIRIENQLAAWAPAYFGTSVTSDVSVAISIGLGFIKPTLVVGYDVARSFNEIVTFTLEADVQDVASDPGDAEVIRLALSSNDVSEPIDTASTDGSEIPIVDVRRRSYMLTDRGKLSAAYLVNRARASLIDRARCVRIPFEVEYDRIGDITLRKSGVLTDPRLPGGAAQGKIVGRRVSGSGDTGEFTLGVVIAPCVGNGGSVAASAGDGVYAQAGYMQLGYQQMEGRSILVAGDVTLADYSGIAPNDDGVDFLSMGPAQAVQSILVTNGPTAQRHSLRGIYKDVAAASEDLQSVATRVCVDLVPLTGGPFETEIPLTCSMLVPPKGIDLSAAP